MEIFVKSGSNIIRHRHKQLIWDGYEVYELRPSMYQKEYAPVMAEQGGPPPKPGPHQFMEIFYHSLPDHLDNAIWVSMGEGMATAELPHMVIAIKLKERKQILIRRHIDWSESHIDPLKAINDVAFHMASVLLDKYHSKNRPEIAGYRTAVETKKRGRPRKGETA